MAATCVAKPSSVYKMSTGRTNIFNQIGDVNSEAMLRSVAKDCCPYLKRAMTQSKIESAVSKVDLLNFRTRCPFGVAMFHKKQQVLCFMCVLLVWPLFHRAWVNSIMIICNSNVPSTPTMWMSNKQHQWSQVWWKLLIILGCMLSRVDLLLQNMTRYIFNFLIFFNAHHFPHDSLRWTNGSTRASTRKRAATVTSVRCNNAWYVLWCILSSLPLPCFSYYIHSHATR